MCAVRCMCVLFSCSSSCTVNNVWSRASRTNHNCIALEQLQNQIPISSQKITSRAARDRQPERRASHKQTTYSCLLGNDWWIASSERSFGILSNWICTRTAHNYSISNPHSIPRKNRLVKVTFIRRKFTSFSSDYKAYSFRLQWNFIVWFGTIENW